MIRLIRNMQISAMSGKSKEKHLVTFVVVVFSVVYHLLMANSDFASAFINYDFLWQFYVAQF